MTSSGVTPGRRRMLLTPIVIFGGRAIGGVLLVAFQVLLARRSGAASLGYFAIALAVTSICSVVGRRGADLLVLRECSIAGSPAAADRAYRVSLVAAVRLLLALAVIQFVAASAVAGGVFGSTGLDGPLQIMSLAVVPYGLVALQGEALKARGHVVSSALCQSLIGSVIALAILAAVPSPSASTGAAAFVVGTVGAAVAGHVSWRLLVHRGGRWREVEPEAVRAFSSRTNPFLLAAVFTLGITWSPILAMGAMAGATDSGLYAAADRIGQIPMMILAAVNGTVGPAFAASWSSGAPDVARRLLRRATRSTALVALVVCGGLALGASSLLGLFGSSFDAEQELRILLAGQFLVLACGPGAIAMAMSGHERFLQRVAGVAFVVEVLLLVVLVPRLDAVGAATASAVAWGGSRAFIAVAARRELSDAAGHVRSRSRAREHAAYVIAARGRRETLP